jgi:cytochrome c oxidase subunit 2
MTPWLPIPASAHAPVLDAVLAGIHWHMLAIFAAWSILFIVALVRFHHRANPRPSDHAANVGWAAAAIGLVVVGDVFILAVQALPAWRARLEPPPAGARPIEVRVIAEQFAWNIHYPGPDGLFGRTGAAFISASNPVGIDRDDPAAADDIGLQNVLTLPVDRTIVIHLSSRDVIHSFTLTEMRVRQDATPGMTVRTWFTPTRTGDWEIACSQLCGHGHYRMRGEYHVVGAEAWEQWLAEELARLR